MTASAEEFDHLLAAAREGDRAAMTRLVELYEPEVRMVARMRLGPALRPYLDSVDLLQSVHRSLLMGLRDQRFEIASPGKLVALALTMVRRKAARQWRRNRRQQRPASPADSSGATLDLFSALQSREADPAREAERLDRAQQLMNELEPIDRSLLGLRMQGLSTVDAARELGLDPDVLRVRLSRLRRRLRDRGFEDDWV